VSLYKGPDGYWIGELRSGELPRLKLSMRTKRKGEAEPRYQALRRLWREAHGPAGAKRRALLDQVRARAVSIERLESMVRDSESLLPAMAGAGPWGTVEATIARYLAWIDANPNKRPSTWRAARAQLRLFAAFVVVVDGAQRPVGELPLDQVTSAMIEDYQRSLLAGGRPPNSVTAYMTRVGALWSWAETREKRLASEQGRPATPLHSPVDPETAARGTSSRDRWLTYEEAERLIAATPERLLCAVALGLFAGLRVGEALTLRPADVDLTLGTLSIREKQVGVDGEGRPVFWKPKTARAARAVPIAPPLAPILERHLSDYASDAWVLPAIEDPAQPFAYATFNFHFQRIVADADMVTGRKDPRGVIYHTLRHTFASWLVMREVDLYTVAQLLGDTLQMTERTYAHLAPDFKKKAIERLRGAVTIGEKTATETATETATDSEETA